MEQIKSFDKKELLKVHQAIKLTKCDYIPFLYHTVYSLNSIMVKKNTMVINFCSDGVLFAKPSICIRGKNTKIQLFSIN